MVNHGMGIDKWITDTNEAHPKSSFSSKGKDLTSIATLVEEDIKEVDDMEGIIVLKGK